MRTLSPATYCDPPFALFVAFVSYKYYCKQIITCQHGNTISWFSSTYIHSCVLIISLYCWPLLSTRRLVDIFKWYVDTHRTLNFDILVLLTISYIHSQPFSFLYIPTQKSTFTGEFLWIKRKYSQLEVSILMIDKSHSSDVSSDFFSSVQGTTIGVIVASAITILACAAAWTELNFGATETFAP